MTAEERGAKWIAELDEVEKMSRSQLLTELTKLSRGGWANARPIDYLPAQIALANTKRKGIRRK